MWVCTQHGFVSVVQDMTQPGHLLVRARDRDHLEALFPGCAISRTPGNDYPWRATMPADAFAMGVTRAVEAIDYPNFKGRVDAVLGGTWYARALHRVWEVLFTAASHRR
jgi:hypothetical protein